MTTWDRNFFLILGTLCIALWLSGCTGALPQAHLQPQVKKHLGRALTDSEVDIREEVVGLEVYGKCGWKGYASLATASLLQGCYHLRCGKDKAWDTDKPCTCLALYLTGLNVERVHERTHCYGWGEL